MTLEFFQRKKKTLRMQKSEVCRSWGWTSTLAWGERDPVKKSKNHVWESNSGTDRSWRGTTCKACSESQTVLRSQQCTRNLAVRTSHHEALRARWTTWSDLLESVTLLKTVVYFGKPQAAGHSSRASTRLTNPVDPAPHMAASEMRGIRIDSTVWGQMGFASDRRLLAEGR